LLNDTRAEMELRIILLIPIFLGNGMYGLNLQESKVQNTLEILKDLNNCPCLKLNECSWIQNTPWKNLSKSNHMRKQFLRFARSKECHIRGDNSKRILCCEMPPSNTGSKIILSSRGSAAKVQNSNSATSKLEIVKQEGMHISSENKCRWRKTKSGELRCIKREK